MASTRFYRREPPDFAPLRRELAWAGPDADAVVECLWALGAPPEAFNVGIVSAVLVELTDAHPWLLDLSFGHHVIRRVTPILRWIATGPKAAKFRRPTDSKRADLHGLGTGPYRGFSFEKPSGSVVDLLRVVLLIDCLGLYYKVLPPREISSEHLDALAGLLIAFVEGKLPPKHLENLGDLSYPGRLAFVWINKVGLLPAHKELSDRRRQALLSSSRAFSGVIHRCLPSKAHAGAAEPSAPAYAPSVPMPSAGAAPSSVEGDRPPRPRPKRKSKPRPNRPVETLRPDRKVVVRSRRKAEHWSETTEPTAIVAVESEATGSIEQPARIAAVIAQRMADAQRDVVLLTTHWDLLTVAEHDAAREYAYEVAESALSEGRTADAAAAVMLALVAITGRDDRYLARSVYLASGDPGTVPTKSRDVFRVDDGIWHHLIPERESRYQPNASQRRLLETIGDDVMIRLPTRCADLLRQLSVDTDAVDGGFREPFKEAPLTLHHRVRALLRAYRSERGARATLARIRRSAVSRFRAESDDHAATTMALGESSGLTTVGCNYFSPKLSTLQSTFDRIHGESRDPSMVTVNGDPRVGSKLWLRDGALQDFLVRLRQNLGHPARIWKLSDKALAEVHNALVVYTIEMLAAATGHRHTSAITLITRRHLSFSAPLIVINDKEVDIGHRGRLCALGQRATHQLGVLLGHYRELINRFPGQDDLHRTIEDAVGGRRSLFFLVDKQWRVRDVTLEGIRRLLPTDWTLPFNVFRHRLATRLREVGCPAEYVVAQLGHLEHGVQPLGAESPILPAHFLSTVSKAIDTVLEEDGWRPAYGLCREPFHPTSIEELRWTPNLDAVAIDIEAKEKRRGEDRRRNFAQRREESSDDTAAAVQTAIRAATPDLADDARDVLLDKETVAAMRHLAIEGVTDDADQIEWRVNALRAELRRRHRELGWSGALPARAFQVRVEASPFIDVLAGEFDHWLALQAWFLRSIELPSHRPTRGKALLLGLILFDTHSSWEMVKRIAGNVKRAEASTKVPSALVVPLDDGKEGAGSVVLRGLSAALACAMRGAGGNARLPSEAEFDRWLQDALPRRKDDTNSVGLSALLSLARVASRFVLTGVERSVRLGILTSVSLASDRVLALLDSDPARRVNSQGSDTIASRPRAGTAGAGDKPASMIDIYRRLRRILHVAKGKEKSFGPGRLILPVGTPEREVRRQIVDHLKELQPLTTGASTMIQSLVEYAIHLTVHGTAKRPDPAFSTVYKYVIDVGIPVLRQFGDLDITMIDEEDFISRYLLIHPPEAESGSTKPSELLIQFHSFLVRAYGVEPIDSAELLPFGRRAAMVDANMVTITEYLAARNELAAKVEALDRAGDLAARRIHLGALLCLIVAWRSSCRFSEIALRRFSDLVDHDGALLLLVRPNQFGRLKSTSSKRVCALHDVLDELEVRWLRSWVEEQRGRLLDRFRPGLPIFGEIENVDHPMECSLLASLVNSALRWATGNEKARSHWMRHGGVTHDVYFCMADRELFDAIPGDVRSAYCRRMSSTEDFLRALAGSSLLSHRHLRAIRYKRGHSRFATTLASYVHVLPLVATIMASDYLKSIAQSVIAAMAGISHANFRQISVRNPPLLDGRSPVIAVLLDRLGARRPDRAISTQPWDAPEVSLAMERRWARPEMIDRFLDTIGSEIRWDLAVRAHALPLTLQRKFCLELARMYCDWPGFWFSIAQLRCWADLCDADEARLILDLASDRRCSGMARSPRSEPIVEAAFAALAGTPDRRLIARSAIVDRANRVVWFAQMPDLVATMTSLIRIGLDRERLVVVLARAGVVDRLRTTIARALGIEDGSTLSIAVLPGTASTAGHAGVGLAIHSRKPGIRGNRRRFIQAVERIAAVERLVGAVARAA